MEHFINPCYYIDNSKIIHQWDTVAKARDYQLRSKSDLSFEYVLSPCIFNLSSDCDWRLVLDAGCGTGVLTEMIAKHATSVVGVDMSSESISIANLNKKQKNILYVNSKIENFSYEKKFNLVIANMLLQDTPNIEKTIKAISQLINPFGCFILTITHPFFWPKYWNYENKPWFSYSDEIAIEASFRISTWDQPIGLTTHFHRPLSAYLSLFINYGFKLIEFIELIPSTEVQLMYPSTWKFPRFLALKLIKK